MKLKFGFSQQLYDTVYNLPPWQKTLIFVVSLVIPVAVFWYMFLSSTWGEIDTIQQKIPDLKREITILKEKEKKIPLLEKELNTMNLILDNALRLLPEKEDIPSILTEISSMGNESRLYFRTFKTQPERLIGFYAAIPFSIEFLGPFHNSLKFFEKISKMPRIVHVKSVKMQKAQKAFSIKSKEAGNEGSDVSLDSAETKTSYEPLAGDKRNLRGREWEIKISCEGETYRFLTPAEQEALKEKEKKVKK